MENRLNAGPAALFPGQGSQTPEMRDDVARLAPDLLARCIELVGEDPFARVTESTRFAQPAIFCASVAYWREHQASPAKVAAHEGAPAHEGDVSMRAIPASPAGINTPSAAAGHSLGEFAALVAAEVLSTDKALELVVLRGKLMAAADDKGSMLALLQSTPEQAKLIADEAGVSLANDNAPGQVILSGDRDKLQSAAAIARAHDLKTIELGVAGAFHSPSMTAAVEPFRAALAEATFNEPQFPVFSGSTTKPFTDFKTELADALLSPVRWRETILELHKAGAQDFLDVGPGTVLARLNKRILRDRDSKPAVNATFKPEVEPEADIEIRRGNNKATTAAAEVSADEAIAAPRSSTLDPADASAAETTSIAANKSAVDNTDPSATTTASILGIGHALPDTVIHSKDIAARLGLEEEWIFRRMGINERRYASEDQTLVQFATEAARNALKDANIRAEQLDLVLVATVTPDAMTPNAAPLVAHELKATKAGAMDIGAACTGWLSALALATAQIEAKRAKYILVVGADLLSRITNHKDKRTAPLFGDAAGAIILGATSSRTNAGVGPILLAADGNYADAIRCSYEDHFVEMDGHETFKAAVRVLSESTEQVCQQIGITPNDLDLFVYHQANGRILDAVAERLGLPTEKVVNYIAKTGNTSSASVPMSLSMARDDGRLKKGDRVLVGAVGAGFVWGSAILEWGGVDSE